MFSYRLILLVLTKNPEENEIQVVLFGNLLKNKAVDEEFSTTMARKDVVDTI